ncbi:hypothetical protein AXF42_Ash000216 [Apostasia shenzhenica]|uniref:Uncharacterized protein n=1 Tax=Apostasia shenzhenica TaxID=1088818 RepID=A0A2I0AFR6_9ASPA|nr:hypothetical protein AXF42_Ash000216 [Apostasia shenzhenica]
MHVEKNIFDNIFNTILDVQGKTKDNAKARANLELYCRRIIKLSACYVLTKDTLRIFCKWAKKFKLPNGYSSNLSRCGNVEYCKFHGMKSHDCHVFISVSSHRVSRIIDKAYMRSNL